MNLFLKQESEFQEEQMKGEENAESAAKRKVFEERGLSDGRLSRFLGKNSLYICKIRHNTDEFDKIHKSKEYIKKT